MTFFSGFSLKGEEAFFAPYIERHGFCVSGFSLGAIEACEYAYHATHRIDKLQLFSPSFFQEEDEKFKRLQLLHYRKDKKAYVSQFLKNASFPSSVDLEPYYHDDTISRLEKLLTYNFDTYKLQDLLDKSIMIEVYLGEEDKIIDAQKAKAFFQEFATVIMIAKSGHILKEKNG